MRILLAGATGYVGRRLKSRLLEEENVVLRLLVRDARLVRESIRHMVEIVEGDIRHSDTVRKAVDGIDTVYYPIRFFGSVWESEGFDRASIESFRDICIEAGVKRLVYVGPHVAEHGSVKLMKNVTDTGMLLGASPEKIQMVWLRAGAPLGSGSVVFELLRDVVQKIPVIVSWRWMDARINSVGVDDLVEYLVQVKDLEARENLTIDIGSGQMSFREMLDATAHIMGLRRVFITLPFTAHHLSSFLLTLATPFSFGLSSALIRALQSGELKASLLDETARLHFPGITPLSFEETMGKAIHEIENDLVMSRWVDTLESIFYVSSEEDVSRAVYRDVKSMCFGEVSPQKIFRTIKSIGGRKGWFTFDFLWRIRGFLEKLTGGYGTAMGKRAVSDLRVGDMLDVWKVVDLKEDKRLLLEAQMKVFGKAWLEFRIEGNTLLQIAYHRPHGALGRVYWYSMLPFHFVIFRDMIRNIIKQARETE